MEPEGRELRREVAGAAGKVEVGDLRLRGWGEYYRRGSTRTFPRQLGET